MRKEDLLIESLSTPVSFRWAVPLNTAEYYEISLLGEGLINGQGKNEFFLY